MAQSGVPATTDETGEDEQAPVVRGVEVAEPTGVALFNGGVPARIPDPPVNEKVPFYKRFWRWWLPKAGRIAGVQNRALSWLTYQLGLRPVGIFMRKKDELDRAPRPVGDTGWSVREDPIHTDPQRIRRPV